MAGRRGGSRPSAPRAAAKHRRGTASSVARPRTTAAGVAARRPRSATSRSAPPGRDRRRGARRPAQRGGPRPAAGPRRAGPDRAPRRSGRGATRRQPGDRPPSPRHRRPDARAVRPPGLPRWDPSRRHPWAHATRGAPPPEDPPATRGAPPPEDPPNCCAAPSALVHLRSDKAIPRFARALSVSRRTGRRRRRAAGSPATPAR